MKKQEKIREAYGCYWDWVKEHVDKNGYYDPCSNNLSYDQDKEIFKICNKSTHANGVTAVYRPKSLLSIDHNNGWIKTEDKSPDPGSYYWVVNSKGLILEAYFTGKFFDIEQELFYYTEVTHYQPIQKPKPPIY